MTDREKLQKAIDILRDNALLFSESEQIGLTKALEILEFHEKYLRIMADSYYYQPTGRACFDKPPGVPILHEETL